MTRDRHGTRRSLDGGSAPPGADDGAATSPTPGGLSLTPERQAILAPKLATLLAELAHLEALETLDLEPDTADPWPEPRPDAGAGSGAGTASETAMATGADADGR